MKQLVLYVGIPTPEAPLEPLKARGSHVILFLSSEEKARYALKSDEAGVTWDDDVLLKRFLHDNMQVWMGGEIHGKDTERKEHFAKILIEIANLMNFDTSSVEVLTKNKQPTRNAFRNFRYCEDGIPMRRAWEFAKGTAAVIVAAGPSLNAQWKELKRFRETTQKGVIFIVCGRIYKKAMQEGLIPDFVVEVEQFDWDDRLWHFAPEPPKAAVLCGPLTAAPGIYNAWPDQKQVMMMADHNLAELMGWELYRDSTDGGNSVLHHMFELACWIGSNEIYLAGVDLSYPEGAKDTHADGGFPGWPKDVLSAEHTRQEPMQVPGTAGKDVTASPGYRNFCIFLEMQISKHRKGVQRGNFAAIPAKPNLKVYNLSPNGQKIEGTEFRRIEECFPAASPAPSSSPQGSSSPSGAPSEWGSGNGSPTFIPFESTPMVCELPKRDTSGASKTGKPSDVAKTPDLTLLPKSRKTTGVPPKASSKSTRTTRS